jgi:hypothetical protein
MNTYTYTEIQTKFPKAWSKLPSSYRNDSCLVFYSDCNDNLCADHDLGGSYLWTGKRWVQIEEN